MKGGFSLNNVMLVGRLVQDVEVNKLESGKEVARISLAVNRSFKNADGMYEVDFIDCILWDGLAKNIQEYCKRGDTVGVRGRLQVSHYEKDDVKRKAVDVVAERMTFIASSKENIINSLEKENASVKKTSKSKKNE